MPRVNIANLDQMPDGPGTLVPGRYTVECINKEETVSQRTNRGGLRLELKPLDGPDMEDGRPCNQFPFPVRTTLWYPMPGDPQKTIDALGSRIKEACQAFDVPIDSEGFDDDDFLGAQADCEIVPQKDNPRYREVDRFIVER